MASKLEKTSSRTNPPASRLVDVAQMAGVSTMSVSRVLNGGTGTARVSEGTAKRIRSAAKKLGYQPNHAAQLLLGKRSHVYGLLVASAGDPLRAFLVQYLDTEVVNRGCHTLIGNTIGQPNDAPDQFGHLVADFSRRKVDGVLCAVHNWCEGDRQQLTIHHPNTVFYEDPGIPDAPYVTVDREAAIRLAVRHLVERGHQRIGLAIMAMSRQTHRDRRRGYELELAENGLPVDENLIFCGNDDNPAFAHHNKQARRWEMPVEVIDQAIDALVRDGRADAIIAHDDFWASALIKRMRARGIVVPNNVAVVGYLNHYLCDWVDPAITSIDLCHDDAAKAMVEMLEKMVTEGPLREEERVVRIKPKLIVRDST